MTPTLPIDDALPALREALRARAVAVLEAPPGAGKTTRVPLALLEEPPLLSPLYSSSSEQAVSVARASMERASRERSLCIVVCGLWVVGLRWAARGGPQRSGGPR